MDQIEFVKKEASILHKFLVYEFLKRKQKVKIYLKLCEYFTEAALKV
mgnify:FL=1